MHKIGERLILSATLIGLTVAFYPGTSRAETKAGVAHTVQNHVFSILRGNQEPLTVGKDIFMDQQVRTESDSETQLLLLDQTDFRIGPSSNIIIDRFVFDPDRPKGDVVINVTRGVFRFVTGKQDPSSYHINTPTATVGVRGTVVELHCTLNSAGKPMCEYLLITGAIDLQLTNPSSPEFAFVSIENPNTLITVEDGKYKTSSWTAQNSLYQARASGETTGAIGNTAGTQGAGGSSFATTRGIIANNSNTTRGTQNGSGGSNNFTFTSGAPGGIAPTAPKPVSP